MKSNSSFVVVFEDDKWRSQNISEPIPLWLDSESLVISQNFNPNNSLLMNGRVKNINSLGTLSQTPQGAVTFQPRTEDLKQIARSHFQLISQSGTGPYTSTLNPLKNHPTYGAGVPAEGTYGSYDAGVYSVSFLKRYFTTSDNSGTNSIFFSNGICNKLSFDLSTSEDLKVTADYKFREAVVGTKINAIANSTEMGTYSTDGPFTWFHGTISFDGVDIPLKRINFNSNNNLEDKYILGRRDPDSFSFNNFVVQGEYEIDFPSDGLLMLGSMIGLKPFSITGTLYKADDNLISFSMPNCLRRDFTPLLNSNRITATIPFEAFESNGTSPLILTIINGTTIEEILYYDAGAGARTVSSFGTIWDAGNGARTVSGFDVIIDRGLV